MDKISAYLIADTLVVRGYNPTGDRQFPGHVAHLFEKTEGDLHVVIAHKEMRNPEEPDELAIYAGARERPIAEFVIPENLSELNQVISFFIDDKQ